MRVNPLIAPIIFIVVLVGTLVTSQVTGNWNVSGRVAIDPSTQIAIADIKGWMTLQQVIDGIPIAREDLYALIGVPAEVPSSTALKDLEPLVPGFEISGLRDALTKRVETASALNITSPAVPQATLTIQVTSPATPVPPTPAATMRSSTTPLPNGQVLPAAQIKGKMTLREISDQCAVPLDALLKSWNFPPTAIPIPR